MSSPAVYTIPEAAVVLGIGRNQAYAAAASGDIPTIRIGKRILVPKAAIDTLLNRPLDAPAVPPVAQGPRPVILKVPRRPPGPPQMTVSARIPVDLNNRLVEAAMARGVSLGAEIVARLSSTFGSAGVAE
jgi:excisionase family DNA binding protein